MPAFVEFTPTPAPGLRSIFRAASDDALDLLSRMMAFDASRRISAAEALQHRYFRTDPLPTPVERLPRPVAAGAGAGAPQQPQQPAAVAAPAGAAAQPQQQAAQQVSPSTPPAHMLAAAAAD